jgi:hypothetical protein
MTGNGAGWVADQVERWPVGRLAPYARNPRVHTKEHVGRLAASMERWGVTMPILVDEAGEIIAGHGRVLAAQSLSYAELPVLVARGWSDADKKAYRIADNRLGELSTWDGALLAAELAELNVGDFDLELMGYSAKDLSELLAPVGDLVADENKSALLELVNVTVGDPSHKVQEGEHYVLSERHHLICASVISGWPKWSPLLTEGALFCPYPGVFVPFSKRAKQHALIMVQPDAYVAGHILDRYSEIMTDAAIGKVA